MNESKKIKYLILGSGPTGLGAAYQFTELGETNWLLLEESAHPGGLSSSFVDPNGFTWDIGGHVQFSHYDYYDKAIKRFLGEDGYFEHQRESWVWMDGKFIPYPLQYNIHQLPKEKLKKCLDGLVDNLGQPKATPENFQSWINQNFGRGLAEVFMNPYNFKVWAYPPSMLNKEWVGERVAVTDLKRVLENLVYQKDDISWGPNSTFLFPKHGGTGAMWNGCYKLLDSNKFKFNEKVVSIDLKLKTVKTVSGNHYHYEHLISTIPLDKLVEFSNQIQFRDVVKKGLLYSSSNIIGIGLKGKVPEHLKTKCWMYFPEGDSPFYRVTVFSNYSPNHVPINGEYWSLMCEVSESETKPVNHDTLLKDVINGCLSSKLIYDSNDIVSKWMFKASHGYPTPGVHRDEAISSILPFYEELRVYSRGRFGLWKYEVSNQDHSFMQGVEVVERLINQRTEFTAFDANYVNSKKHVWPFDRWR